MTTLLVFLGIASCASRPSVEVDGKPVAELALAIAQPPTDLTVPCTGPVDLRGYQSLNAGPVERLWFTDRASLSECRDRKAALQRFYAERDAALAGD